MRVAVIGSRGMPDVPGGIERHVQELYPRLARLGVDVTVYARRPYVPHDCVTAGVRVLVLPSFGGRYGEALSHTALSLVHASYHGFDLVHVHAIGPGVLLPLARLLGLRPSVLTFHSFDYERSKWGPRARTFLRFCERVSIRYADALIAVSAAGIEHIGATYSRSVIHIPNGPGTLQPRPPGKLMARLALTPGQYVLSVGRLSPEKCLEDLIVAAAETLPQTTLVLAGDTSFTDDYIAHLRALAGQQVVFCGSLQGSELEELYCSALVYVIASEIEGLSLSLLEAMSLGCAIVASDIPGNREALGDPPTGLTFPARDRDALGAALRRLAGDAPLRATLGEAAAARVQTAFNWDAAAAMTLKVYENALSRPSAQIRGVRRTLAAAPARLVSKISAATEGIPTIRSLRQALRPHIRVKEVPESDIVAVHPLIAPDERPIEANLGDRAARYIAWIRQQPIGYLQMSYGPTGGFAFEGCWIVRLYVDAKWRAAGVGGALLRTALRRAAQDGWAEVFLFVRADNLPGIGLYRKAGFEQVESTQASEWIKQHHEKTGETLCAMRCDLAPCPAGKDEDAANHSANDSCT